MTITIWDILTGILLRPMVLCCLVIAAVLAIILIAIIVGGVLGFAKVAKEIFWGPVITWDDLQQNDEDGTQ